MSSSITWIKAIVEANSCVKGLAFLFVLFELASYVRSKQIFLAQSEVYSVPERVVEFFKVVLTLPLQLKEEFSHYAI